MFAISNRARQHASTPVQPVCAHPSSTYVLAHQSLHALVLAPYVYGCQPTRPACTAVSWGSPAPTSTRACGSPSCSLASSMLVSTPRPRTRWHLSHLCALTLPLHQHHTSSPKHAHIRAGHGRTYCQCARRAYPSLRAASPMPPSDQASCQRQLACPPATAASPRTLIGTRAAYYPVPARGILPASMPIPCTPDPSSRYTSSTRAPHISRPGRCRPGPRANSRVHAVLGQHIAPTCCDI